MAVLSREALEASPLADLHVLAGELGIDGYRRLRKQDLVEAVIARQSGEEGTTDEGAGDDDAVVAAETPAADEAKSDDDEDGAPRRRGRRGGRRRRSEESTVTVSSPDGDEVEYVTDDAPEASSDDDDEDEKPRGGRSRGGRSRGGRGRDRDRDRDGDNGDDRGEERNVEGTVELLGNGSGFVRVSPPEPSDDDVYVSAAQIRRCELVSGDKVTGPMRAPRRSERYPSLVRIDTINGRSADEVVEGTPFDDLAATFPTERLALGADDPTLKAIEWLTPIGRGSRATIVGAARAGKSEALRRLAGALTAQEGLELHVVLAGVRPEEIAAWRETGVDPANVLTFAASPDAQGQAVERVVETAKRIAARGGDAVVLIDTLSYLDPRSARKVLSAARNIADGGSLTIVATSDLPVGGETTVVALDTALTSTGRFPALDLVASGTLRPELLVGDAGAEAIAQARAAALG